MNKILSDSKKEALRKLAEAKRGKKLSPEHRLKLSKANLGKKNSPETRRKLSEALRGRKTWPRSIETRLNMSKAQIGVPRTTDTQKKGPSHFASISGYLRDSFGKVWHFINLTHFVRENPDLFAPEDVIWKHYRKGRAVWCNARGGLGSLFKRSGRVRGSWKGWTVAFSIMERAEGGGDLIGRDSATVVDLAK